MPHRGGAILLDRLRSLSQESAVVEVDIRSGVPFSEPRGVPAHVGLEYMAQACAVWSGSLQREIGQPARIGFLLGSRDFKSEVPYFPFGVTLVVSATVEYQDGDMGVFKCDIRIGDTVFVTAHISVYQPTSDAGRGGIKQQNDTGNRGQ
jgi:predicted hotdog family 3-hydroxylacyl-ACP dehydratase